MPNLFILKGKTSYKTKRINRSQRVLSMLFMKVSLAGKKLVSYIFGIVLIIK